MAAGVVLILHIRSLDSADQILVINGLLFLFLCSKHYTNIPPTHY